MSAVTIGELRHRVHIERPERTADGAGGATIAWPLYAEGWAAISPRGAGEAIAFDRVDGRADHEVWMRHRPGVTTDMRIRFGSRVFAIRSVIDVEERGRWLKLGCEERDL